MAQNMVPNGDFEQYTSCPTGNGQITNCIGWSQYQISCDYFNSCVTGTGPSVPVNNFGSQAAASGSSYGGLAVYSVSSSREALGKTISPLTVGSVYEVSMSVSLADNSLYGLNSLGIRFIQNGSTIGNTALIAATTPQISFSSYGPISNKSGWTRLSALLMADSAYNFIVITGWGPHTAYTLDTTSSGQSTYSYYYIDSVVIKIASGINNLYLDSLICAGDTFQVPYTLNNNTVFTSSNVFSVQLSNSSGSFNGGTSIIGTHVGNTAGSISCVVPTTIVPGSNYRIRILSNNAVDSSGANVRDISIGVTRPNVSNSSNSPICIGQQLNLMATSATTGVSYKWTGPGGFSGNTQNPTINNVTTTNAGDYIVTARLYGCLAKDTTTVTVTNASASNVIAAVSTPICERDTLYLNATVGIVANSYSWSGPGFNSNSKDTLRANSLPAMSGDYVFTANYTGCTIRDTITVLVKPQAANRTIGSNSPLCTGNMFTLNAGSSSTGVAYTWTGPNSFVATTPSASITNTALSNAGMYVVNYLLNGCLTKDSLNVVINPSPLPVTANANTPLCEGATLNLNCTNSTSGVGYSWVGPGVYTSTSQSPTRANVIPAMSGDYIVMATNGFNCTSKDTVTVLVKPLPANVNAGTNAPICEGNTLFLTGNTSTSGVSFSWTGPNVFSSTLQNPNFSPATTIRTGSYILAATLNGCSVQDTVYAQVNPIPLKPTASANTPVCVGQDLQLAASTVAGATYNWTSTTGYSSTGQYPVRSSATTLYAGKYYVTATANGCTSAADSVTVAVNPAPTISMYPSPKDSICVGQNVTFVSSNSNAGSSYTRSWFKNNNVIGGAANANYSTTTAADGDEYYVTLTAYGVCATPYTDTSNAIKMRVLPWLAPAVSITANPNTTVPSGTMINFTATPTNGGNKSGYQWTRNGLPIVGATSNIWGASTLSNNDLICVDMTSNYLCPNPKTVKSNCIKVSIESTGITGIWTGKEPSIYPNPATEKLIIEGIVKGTKIQLYDVIGRVVIKETSTATTTELNMAHLVPGNYVLTLSTETGDRMSVKVVKE